MENRHRELISVINALYEVLDVVVVRAALLALLIGGARELVKGHRRPRYRRLQHKIAGMGKFRSGVRDLGSSKTHLKNFGG
jgi:hypothetical protein